MSNTCGFRISATDVCAILAGALATYFAWSLVGEFALIAPLALGHFFLFCSPPFPFKSSNAKLDLHSHPT